MTIMYIQYGSIPECAGEPAAAPSLARPFRVYPGVCGGTANLRAELAAFGGLSPRVRGNPAAPELGTALRGSIPACAGEPGSDAD